MDKRNVRVILTLLLIPITLSIACSLALADGGVAAASTWKLAFIAPYVPILVPLLAGLQSIVVRGQTSASGWWHGTVGHTLLVLIGAGMGAGLDFLKGGVWTKEAVIAAVAGATAAFFGAWKTTGKDDSTSTSSAPKQAGFSRLDVLTTLCVLALAACGTLYGQKYAACIEAKGISAAQNLPSDVNTILTSGSPKDTAVSQLEGLAGQAALDAVGCAVSAWLDSHPVPQNASSSPILLAGREAAHAYLAKHPAPTTCRPHETL